MRSHINGKRPSVTYSVTEDISSSSRSSRKSDNVASKCCVIGSKVPARVVLYFLSWSGFLVSFMMRNDINFALVAMVKSDTNSSTSSNLTSLLKNHLVENNKALDTIAINMTKVTSNMTNMNNIIDMISDSNQSIFEESNKVPLSNLKDNNYNSDMNQYAWSSATKSLILSSFYWCYVLSQVVGGIATQHFGTKRVFGWSQFATAACSVCMPFAADIHYSVVILLRSIQGFASGLTWPAMFAIVGYWIPLSERSRFMSSFQGFSIGIGLTYPLCGFIIDNFGWRYVFFTTGSLGLLWCLIWYFLAFNTPQEHPRISPEELEYIEVNISNELKEAHGMKVPWKKIFTSLPAWAIGITTFGRIWIHYTFIIGGPIFMKHILGFDYKSNGLLSGMPFLCSYISAVFFCYIADKLVCHQLMSLTNVRKVFTAASQIIPGVLMFWIGYINHNIVLLLVIWFIAVSLITASYAGAMANIVDIAPNLAGPVLAFCQTIHMSASFISPLVAGFIVTNEDSIEQWRTVFGVSAAVTISTYIMYQIFGTADIQKWNYAQHRIDSEESEVLKPNNKEAKIVIR